MLIKQFGISETVIHNKTGNIYFVLDVLLDATNSREGQCIVIYMNVLGKVFAREQNEFYEKFTVK